MGTHPTLMLWKRGPLAEAAPEGNPLTFTKVMEFGAIALTFAERAARGVEWAFKLGEARIDESMR